MPLGVRTTLVIHVEWRQRLPAPVAIDPLLGPRLPRHRRCRTRSGVTSRDVSRLRARQWPKSRSKCSLRTQALQSEGLFHSSHCRSSGKCCAIGSA